MDLEKSTEKQRENIAIATIVGLAGVTGLELVRKAQRSSILSQTQGPLTDGTLPYFLVHNTGDFFDGYAITAAVYLILNHITPNLPEKFKLGTSLAVACSAVVITETILPFWTPDVADIPFGILGTVGYLGTYFAARQFHNRHQLPTD